MTAATVGARGAAARLAVVTFKAGAFATLAITDTFTRALQKLVTTVVVHGSCCKCKTHWASSEAAISTHPNLTTVHGTMISVARSCHIATSVGIVMAVSVRLGVRGSIADGFIQVGVTSCVALAYIMGVADTVAGAMVGA